MKGVGKNIELERLCSKMKKYNIMGMLFRVLKSRNAKSVFDCDAKRVRFEQSLLGRVPSNVSKIRCFSVGAILEISWEYRNEKLAYIVRVVEDKSSRMKKNVELVDGGDVLDKRSATDRVLARGIISVLRRVKIRKLSGKEAMVYEL